MFSTPVLKVCVQSTRSALLCLWHDGVLHPDTVAQCSEPEPVTHSPRRGDGSERPLVLVDPAEHDVYVKRTQTLWSTGQDALVTDLVTVTVSAEGSPTHAVSKSICIPMGCYARVGLAGLLLAAQEKLTHWTMGTRYIVSICDDGDQSAAGRVVLDVIVCLWRDIRQMLIDAVEDGRKRAEVPFRSLLMVGLPRSYGRDRKVVPLEMIERNGQVYHVLPPHAEEVYYSIVESAWIAERLRMIKASAPVYWSVRMRVRDHTRILRGEQGCLVCFPISPLPKRSSSSPTSCDAAADVQVLDKVVVSLRLSYVTGFVSRWPSASKKDGDHRVESSSSFLSQSSFLSSSFSSSSPVLSSSFTSESSSSSFSSSSSSSALSSSSSSSFASTIDHCWCLQHHYIDVIETELSFVRRAPK